MASDSVQAVALELTSQATLTPTRLCDAAILFGYLATVEEEQNSESWFDHANSFLQLASRLAHAHVSTSGLHGGLAGVAWTVEHLVGLFRSPNNTPQPEFADPLVDADRVLLRCLKRNAWQGRYDLIGGLVGLGIYFLERLPRITAREGIDLIVRRLRELSAPSVHGRTWHTPPALLPDWQRARFPSGYYNLGVAHGVPGVIYLLAEAVRAEIGPAETHQLLNAAVEWLLSQRVYGATFCFPHWSAPDAILDSQSRLAWCYGDVGIAGVLDHVGSRLNRNEWRQIAQEILTHCIHSFPDKEPVPDAALCHGACGIAHVFNRVYQSTHDQRYKHTAVTWYAHALASREPGKGVGGFSAWVPERRSVPDPNPSFLGGSVGIALALLAGFGSREPGWDRLLALSGRP